MARGFGLPWGMQLNAANRFTVRFFVFFIRIQQYQSLTHFKLIDKMLRQSMCSNIFNCMDLFKVRIIKFAIIGSINYYAKTFEAYLLQLKPV